MTETSEDPLTTHLFLPAQVGSLTLRGLGPVFTDLTALVCRSPQGPKMLPPPTLRDDTDPTPDTFPPQTPTPTVTDVHRESTLST